MDHISFTQLSMLLRCGEQYNRRYINGEILAPSGSMIRGKAAHKAEEKNFVQKIKSLEDLPVEAVRDIFSDEWESQKYGIAWTPEELQGDSPTKKEGEYKDMGISLVEVYHKELAPSALPVSVEEKFIVEFQGGYPNLTGIIDRIDEGGQVIDMKFVGKSPAEGDINKDIQITAYDLGYRKIRKKKPTVLRKEFSVATKKPKTMIQEAPARDDDVIDRFLFRLEKTMEVIGKGVFQPAPVGAWWCSEKFCGYYQTCKYRP